MARRRSRFVPPKGAMTVQRGSRGDRIQCSENFQVTGREPDSWQFQAEGSATDPLSSQIPDYEGGREATGQVAAETESFGGGPERGTGHGRELLHKAGVFGGGRIHDCGEPLAGTFFAGRPGPRALHALRPYKQRGSCVFRQRSAGAVAAGRDRVDDQSAVLGHLHTDNGGGVRERGRRAVLFDGEGAIRGPGHSTDMV